MGAVVLRRRWWMLVLAAVLVVGLVAVVTTTGIRRARYGDVHEEAGGAVAVGRGHRFSLAVPDRGASVGDHWTAAVAPEGVVALVRSEQPDADVAAWLFGPLNGGGAGTRYFVFDARRPGAVTITLHNCFQGCRDDGTRSESREIAWTVTVSP